MKETKTALITGASSGIGKAIAFELAQQGYDLILVARTKLALEEMRAQIGENRVRIFVLDLTRPEEAKKLVSQVGQVDLLVNNAGFGSYGEFAKSSLERELEMVELQVSTPLLLIKTFLPKMIQQGRGRILNVGSVYSFMPVPFQSVYGGCKSFLLAFSLAIANEVASSGVTVTTLCPGITSTSFRTAAGMKEKKSRFAMSSEEVARYGLKALFRGKVIAIPGFTNRVLVAASRIIPPTWFIWGLRKVNQYRGVNKSM